MKPSFSPARYVGSIEPLEARIAPARVILTGVPDTRQYENFPHLDVDYSDPGFFVNTESNPADPISAAVGGGAPGVNDTFYLKMSAGDILQVFNQSNGLSDAYFQVKTGNVVAFFIDKNLDNEVQANELVSISAGKNASMILKSTLEGDLVTNLNEHGTKSTADDTLDMSGQVGGLVSAAQGLKGFSVGGGDVGGKIISGGNISNVQVTAGTVTQILAGSAANGATFDFFPGVVGGDGAIVFSQPAKVAGASISNVAVGGIGRSSDPQPDDRIQAGDGGLGAAGGFVKNIQILNDSTGFLIKAGAGGNGINNGHGGNGGLISSVIVAGISDNTPNALIKIVAGHGGDASTSGSGGKGGGVSTVHVGFQLIGNKPFATIPRLSDDILIQGGAGGSGKIGGAGGNIGILGGATPSIQLLSTTPPNGVIPPSGAGPSEISILAGVGGDSTSGGTGGKTGVGGSILSVDVENVSLTVGAGVLLHAGDGGNTVGSALGSAGGSVKTISLLTTNFTVEAGNGSGGKTGGNGGGLSGISVQQNGPIYATDGVFNAGFGGDGAAGKGGLGGAISTLNVANSDFISLAINSGNAGNGGKGTGSTGGAGGAVSGLNITDTDSPAGNLGAFTLRTGKGGDGTKGTGAGGAFSTSTFTSLNMSIDIQTGAGGNVLGGGTGKGGAGGLMKNLQITAESSQDTQSVDTFLQAGGGGNGGGTRGIGGVGGSINGADVSIVEGVPGITTTSGLSVIAGPGGSGSGGAAGSGGSIISSGAFNDLGGGTMIAGSAGVNGAGRAVGGSIMGASNAKLAGLFASTDLFIQAGDGSHGGAGGSLTNFGYGSTAGAVTASGLPAPTGNITLLGGVGSAEGKFAGAGGSITFVTGAIGSNDAGAGTGTVTLIQAGNGGGGPSVAKTGAGGSVSNLTLAVGGGLGAELQIQAGDAGNGGSGVKVGAKGGNVQGVIVAPGPDVDPQTIVRFIAAGDGGAAGGTGGTGGNIDSVHVRDHDIGVREGQAYGLTTMGGLFAGVGGTGGTAAGVPGNVTNVTASAIAAIVAGRGATPQFAGVVQSIYIGTSPSATAAPVTNLLDGRVGDLNLNDGGDPNYYAYNLTPYETKNLVGAVVDPTAQDANKFHFNDANNDGIYQAGEVPIDGLIMATIFNQKLANFTPEAELTLRASYPGQVAGFYDYNNLPV